MSKPSELAEEIAKALFEITWTGTKEERLALIDQKLSGVREAYRTLLTGAVIPQITQKRRMSKIWQSIKTEE